MIPFLLASDFGNLWAMITLLPITGISLLAALVCLLMKWKNTCRVLGAIAVLCSGLFLLTIGEAREFDKAFTLILGCLVSYSVHSSSDSDHAIPDRDAEVIVGSGVNAQGTSLEARPLGFCCSKIEGHYAVFIAAPRMRLVLGRMTRGSTCSALRRLARTSLPEIDTGFSSLCFSHRSTRPHDS